MSEHISRRKFIGAALAAGSLVAPSPAPASSVVANDVEENKDVAASSLKASFSCDERRLRFYSKAFREPIKILHISDAHLFLDDERGADYREYSDRMAKAYNAPKYYKTGETTTPMKMFELIVDQARSQDLDAVILTGDIVSFPSAAGVDFVLEQLEKLNVPFYYVAGNHDWHFEGMQGTERELRDEWIEKRLKPLYPKEADPLSYSVEIKGVNFILVDDSIYEILPSQLEFVQKELAKGKPSLLFMHVPLYAPGRNVGFGVAHPDWNAASDRNYKIERRPQWPQEGHTETTYAFRKTVLESPNLLGSFQGHIHRQSIDVCNGKPLVVTPAALDGSTSTLELQPTATDV